MNTDKLISDALNNRASSLDLPPEKFEKMLEYIESHGEIEQNNSLYKFIDTVKSIKTAFSMKSLLKISLFIIIIISAPVILKNAGSFGAKKASESQVSNNSDYWAGNEAAAPSTGFGPEEPKSEEAPTQEDSDRNNGSRGGHRIILTLAPQNISNSQVAYVSFEKIEKNIAELRAKGADTIYLNDILITETTVIKKGETIYYMLVDDIKVSLTEPVTLMVAD
ncbi:hypothetical protein [Clostridium thermarum]|uniref:hypothetical protein n=1 Tax=Clostridium thermarum TaxID=1716543 RepID=UPI001121126A|nr:hypothetical protein [Clostridium thermarum]